MSCQDCIDAQEREEYAPYRLDNACLLLKGCQKHLAQAMTMLNFAQAAAEADRLHMAQERAVAEMAQLLGEARGFYKGKP